MRAHTRSHTSDAALTDLGGVDEVGTPAADLVECDCGTIHREGDDYHPTVCTESNT